MSKLETNTIDNISGSSTLTVGDSNTSTISIPKNITLGASGTTITVPSGATITNNGTQTGFGGTNTPAFEAYLSANQTVSDGAETKAQVNTEVFDTDNCYDNSTNYRFTPTVAGKYFVYGKVAVDEAAGNTRLGISMIFKNGSEVGRAFVNFDVSGFPEGEGCAVTNTAIVDMNGSSDYIELYGVHDVLSGSGRFQGDATRRYTSFGAYRIIT